MCRSMRRTCACTCAGPTVYDYAHIGNARPVVVFDVLFRLLRHMYGAKHVTYVRNITDVDDKINARAAEEGVSIRDLTERTAKQFHDDIKALGVLPPTVEPRATEHIEEMKALIEALIANGNAYVAEGHVLFHVPSMPDYGKLSNRTLDEMAAGARVEVAPVQERPDGLRAVEAVDKPRRAVVAVARRHRGARAPRLAHRVLGHGGEAPRPGVRHPRRRHRPRLSAPRERDRAVALRARTPVMARYWLHNGFLQVEGEKMSKSLGNFITIHDLLKEWPGEVVRFNMLRTHYRQPIDWTKTSLEESQATLDRWGEISDRLGGALVEGGLPDSARRRCAAATISTRRSPSLACTSSPRRRRAATTRPARSGWHRRPSLASTFPVGARACSVQTWSR